MSRARRLLAAAQATKPWRAWARYGTARGNVLAGGVAYVGFFSLFPALAVGFTVAGLVLGGRRDLQLKVADSINSTFGNVIIGTSPGKGVVPMERLVEGNLLGLTGAIGLGVLLLTGLGWVDAMRQGIRAVFGLPDEGNPVLAKLVDVVVLAVVGIGILASVVASLALTAASGAVLDWLNMPTSGVSRFLVAFVIDVALVGVDLLLFLAFFRIMARVPVPVIDLLGSALIGALGLFVLKLSGGLLLRVASGNRFLAASSIVVGLLLWFNLAARLVLLSAAWAATTATDRGIVLDAGPPAAAVVPAAQSPAGRSVAGTPTYGQRAADRTTIAAGAILGAGAVAVLSLLSAQLRGRIGRIGRSTRGAARRADRRPAGSG